MARAGPSRLLYPILAQLATLLFDLFTRKSRRDPQQDLEILLLRQQRRIRPRPQSDRPCPARWEKLGLAVLAARFTGRGRGAKTKLDPVLWLCKPDPVLKWHRAVVRRQWRFDNRPKNGRPATDPALPTLLRRLAQENPSGGTSKLPGELLQLGDTIGRSTVSDIRQRQHVAPVPERVKPGGRWRTLLRHYGQQVLAGAFFTVETAWLKTR